MAKFSLALLVVAAVAFFAASAGAILAPAVQAPTVQAPNDQGGGITPGVGLDSIPAPRGGHKTKSRKSLP